MENNSNNVPQTSFNFKPCKKKQYDIYACLPPLGTVVINKLEQARVLKLTNGKTWFSLSEIKGDPRKKALCQMLLSRGQAYLVSEQTPVVLAGTVGEYWAIDFNTLMQKYVIPTQGRSTSITKEVIEEKTKGPNAKLVDWFKIRSLAGSGEAFASFVPKNKKMYIKTSWGAVLQVNGPGVKHGKGDFVLCAKTPEGNRDETQMWVVNGLVFGSTYSNAGWEGYIDTVGLEKYSVTIQNLPRTITVSRGLRGSESACELFALYGMIDTHVNHKEYDITFNKNNDPLKSKRVSKGRNIDLETVYVNQVGNNLLYGYVEKDTMKMHLTFVHTQGSNNYGDSERVRNFETIGNWIKEYDRVTTFLTEGMRFLKENR